MDSVYDDKLLKSQCIETENGSNNNYNNNEATYCPVRSIPHEKQQRQMITFTHRSCVSVSLIVANMRWLASLPPDDKKTFPIRNTSLCPFSAGIWPESSRFPASAGQAEWGLLKRLSHVQNELFPSTKSRSPQFNQPILSTVWYEDSQDIPG